jgi:hypothetical protein
MDTEQRAARGHIVGACLQLAVGDEAAFDYDLVHDAYPAKLGASSEDRLMADLRAAGLGTFRCRRDVANSDYIISRDGNDDDLPLRDLA